MGLELFEPNTEYTQNLDSKFISKEQEVPCQQSTKTSMILRQQTQFT